LEDRTTAGSCLAGSRYYTPTALLNIHLQSHAAPQAHPDRRRPLPGLHSLTKSSENASANRLWRRLIRGKLLPRPPARLNSAETAARPAPESPPPASETRPQPPQTRRIGKRHVLIGNVARPAQHAHRPRQRGHALFHRASIERSARRHEPAGDDQEFFGVL
jgi:hypothetical protein